MSCYNPSLAIRHVDVGTGELIWEFHGYGSGKYYDPRLATPEQKENWFLVPCKKCLGCRLDYSRKWADRMLLEFLASGKKALFVTMTYNPDNLPYTAQTANYDTLPTLNKKDAQDFLKRLRYYYPDKTIRYYLAGEYGPKTQRPHYHAIIFGLSTDDFPDLRYSGQNELHMAHYMSPKFQDIWSKGFCTINDANYKTFAYVSRYVMKKVYKEEDDDWYQGRTPEYTVMSRRPGIGMPYVEQHPDMEKLKTYVSDGVTGSHCIYIPDIMLKVLTNDEEYATIKAQRRELANDGLLMQLNQSDLEPSLYYKEKERKHFDRLGTVRNRKEM